MLMVAECAKLSNHVLIEFRFECDLSVLKLETNTILYSIRPNVLNKG